MGEFAKGRADWSNLRVFYAVAQTGGINAACQTSCQPGQRQVCTTDSECQSQTPGSFCNVDAGAGAGGGAGFALPIMLPTMCVVPAPDAGMEAGSSPDGSTTTDASTTADAVAPADAMSTPDAPAPSDASTASDATGE